MGEKFPAVLLNHPHAQTSSAGLCNVRLSFSFLGHLSCKAQKKASGAYADNNSTNILPSWQKLNQYASFTIPQYSSRGLRD